MKTIGYCNGQQVIYSPGYVRVVNTSILICGCKDEEDAVRTAEKNLVGFKKL